jgi:hypothetical protein
MTKKRQFCPRGHDTFQGGRDAGHRCLQCRREDAEAVAATQAAAAAEREAERQRRWDEIDARHEREYQRAIATGGDVAATARWQRLYDETLDATESKWGLCQWALEDGEPGACTRRTADVYCWVHNRQLERESEKRRRSQHLPPRKEGE